MTWAASDYDETGGYDCMTGAVEIRNTSTDSVIATVDAGDFGGENNYDHKPEVITLVVSTANLIAAAPDMLEALKRQADSMDLSINSASLPDSWYDKYLRELEEIRAVISKAEGK